MKDGSRRARAWGCEAQTATRCEVCSKEYCRRVGMYCSFSLCKSSSQLLLSRGCIRFYLSPSRQDYSFLAVSLLLCHAFVPRQNQPSLVEERFRMLPALFFIYSEVGLKVGTILQGPYPVPLQPMLICVILVTKITTSPWICCVHVEYFIFKYLATVDTGKDTFCSPHPSRQSQTVVLSVLSVSPF